MKTIQEANLCTVLYRNTTDRARQPPAPNLLYVSLLSPMPGPVSCGQMSPCAT